LSNTPPTNPFSRGPSPFERWRKENARKSYLELSKALRESGDDRPSICDYEGSNYRVEFWEGQGRDYEDRVERIALKRLLPESGRRMLEIGAGFGRLTSEYAEKFDQVVLLDYSFSQLEYAREHLGGNGKFIFVAADAYALPFRAGAFDNVSMIRTIHHMANATLALRQVSRVMSDGGTFILEHANKRNFKAMARYALRRQTWSPYTPEPYEFVELNYVFHPDSMLDVLARTGFSVETRVPVSFFRFNLAKRLLPVDMLVNIDGLLQRTGGLISPSVFVKAHKQPTGHAPLHEGDGTPESLFVCPESGGPLHREGDTLYSPRSGLRWAIRDGIYDFKVPVNE
jgi:SAM-dependent methyltransferase